MKTNVVLWVLQGLYAASALMSGVGKVSCLEDSYWERALGMIPWLPVVPRWLFIAIGVFEALGGLGLMLPSLTRVKPLLAPLAGLGLTLIMVLATGFHLVRGELGLMALTALLAGLGAFISYGRWTLRPVRRVDAVTTSVVVRGVLSVAVAAAIVVATLPKK